MSPLRFWNPRLACGLACLLAVQPAQAQAAKKRLEAVRLKTPILLDGKLDETAWAEAPAATGFSVSWPDLGKAASRDTEVRILYDDHYVYVGARMHHAKGQARIVRQVHRRDQDSASDWFGVYLDSLHDRRTAFAFMVNAAGVQQDRVVFADVNEDSSWDGVWESAVTTDADGWSAELKIPLSLLRLKDTHDGQTWGVNFIRSDYLPKPEQSAWQIVPRGVNAWVSTFPELVGIEGVKPQPRREFIPYLSTQRKFETAQGFDDRKWSHGAGLDAHFGINSYSQLDLSLRPDFGQVEVDQAVLNLGTYETFFPEKRPFFLEGMEIFQFTGPTLFYSRRIGQGLGDPELNPGETLVDRPMATQILGAAKYTSKFAGGLNLGILAANVEPARATLRDGSGREAKRELSPMTNATVARVTQAMDERGSFLGGFASHLQEAGPSGREATVGAADLVWKSQDRSGSTELCAVESRAGTRQDASTGHYERLQSNWQWKSGWSLYGALINASRDFNPNDLGYTQRPDRQMAQLDVNRRWDQVSGILRNREWHASYFQQRDQAGKLFDHWFGSWVRTEFTSGWALMLGGERSLPTQDDRELRTFQNPIKKYLPVAAYTRAWTNLDTPNNWPWSLSLRYNHQGREGGASQYLTLFQSIRPTPSLEFQVETNLTREAGETHYLETQGDAPVVGLRRMGQLNQILRVSYAFSPTLTVQMFSQWMDASWNYRDLKTCADDHRLLPGAVPQGATAFSDRLWSLNLITRWEFRPGSTCFLVYTHGVATSELANTRATITPRPDLAYLHHLPSDDAVQLKLSWLFR